MDETTKIQHIVMELPTKQLLRYTGTLQELRSAMPEFRFTILERDLLGVYVLVTKRGRIT